MQTKRHKPSHNKRGTEIRPLHYGGLFPIGVVIELYLLS